MEKKDFDVVVTDLKLPDASGLDVLEFAKRKDEYTEVLMITGYASIDTATSAINMGVSSYLPKPLSIIDFQLQVEKAVASRLFHLKSITLMQHSDQMEPAVKDHLYDLASLYYFTRKLMLSLEVSEIMRITLEEVNQRMNSLCGIIAVDVLGYRELYAMPATGEPDRNAIARIIIDNKEMFPFIDMEKFIKDAEKLYVYKGKQGDPVCLDKVKITGVPLMVTGKSIGMLAAVHEGSKEPDPDQNQFLYIFTSIIASIIEHGYIGILAQQQAKTDSLTGIANHRLFHETLEREIARANRRKGLFTLVLIDIDYFKTINDTYGHQTGDAVLVDLTKRISATIRGGDVLARYGGEEFGLILPDTDIRGAEIFAQRICRDIASHPFVAVQSEIPYTASFGVAQYSGDRPMKKDELVAKADKALYASKRGGKNRVTVSESEV